MDPETFETITLNDNLLGDAKDYLVENLQGRGALHRRPARAGGLALFSAISRLWKRRKVCVAIRPSNVTKPAILETGKTVNVPLFINEGETIKIDTRTGNYMGRLAARHAATAAPTKPFLLARYAARARHASSNHRPQKPAARALGSHRGASKVAPLYCSDARDVAPGITRRSWCRRAG